MKANLNDTITVYPTEKGWMLAKVKWMNDHEYISEEVAEKQFNYLKTENGGLTMPLWKFIQDFGVMVYHGTDLFISNDIELESSETNTVYIKSERDGNEEISS